VLCALLCVVCGVVCCVVWCVVSCRVVSCRVVLCCVVLCCGFVALRCVCCGDGVVLCCVVLCCVKLDAFAFARDVSSYRLDMLRNEDQQTYHCIQSSSSKIRVRVLD
jgi:hypothetical protein